MIENIILCIPKRLLSIHNQNIYSFKDDEVHKILKGIVLYSSDWSFIELKTNNKHFILYAFSFDKKTEVYKHVKKYFEIPKSEYKIIRDLIKSFSAF